MASQWKQGPCRSAARASVTIDTCVTLSSYTGVKWQAGRNAKWGGMWSNGSTYHGDQSICWYFHFLKNPSPPKIRASLPQNKVFAMRIWDFLDSFSSPCHKYGLVGPAHGKSGNQFFAELFVSGCGWRHDVVPTSSQPQIPKLKNKEQGIQVTNERWWFVCATYLSDFKRRFSGETNIICSCSTLQISRKMFFTLSLDKIVHLVFLIYVTCSDRPYCTLLSLV